MTALYTLFACLLAVVTVPVCCFLGGCAWSGAHEFIVWLREGRRTKPPAELPGLSLEEAKQVHRDVAGSFDDLRPAPKARKSMGHNVTYMSDYWRDKHLDGNGAA